MPIAMTYPAPRRNLLILSLVVVLLAGCSTGPARHPHVHMQSANPLVGEVYQAGSSAPTPFPTLLESMKTSDVVYLGETHDNPFHHHIEQQVIFQLIDQGLRPAVGFEFFSREQTSHLLRYRNGGKKEASGKRHGSPAAAEKLLRVQLGWEGNRERDWQRFLPILRKVRELQLPVFGADLSAGLKVSLTRHGYDGLNGVEKMLVTRTTFDDPGHRDWMAERLRAMHCGWGDDAYINRLYQTWLARNEAMAESIVAMVRDNPGQPVVVIMGGGHLEYNLGVYERVHNLMPEARQLNIRMQQVTDELTQAADYFEPLRRNGRDYGPRHDYLWFTSGPPRREHSCADMHMQTAQAQVTRAAADR